MKFALLCLIGVSLVAHCSGIPRYWDVPLYRGECPTACTMEWNPVCAADSESGKTKTFGNPCTLTVHNCIHNTNYKKIANGECPEAQ